MKKRIVPKVGDTINFKFYFWVGNKKISIQNYSSKVLSIITDPLRKHEDKFVVEINNQKFGIPVSDIIGKTV